MERSSFCWHGNPWLMLAIKLLCEQTQKHYDDVLCIYTHTWSMHDNIFATFLSSTFCSDAKWLLCASLLFISGTSEQMFLNTTQQRGNRQRKGLGGSLQFTVVMYPPIHAAWANCMSLGRRARLLKYSWELTNKCVRRVQFFAHTFVSTHWCSGLRSSVM